MMNIDFVPSPLKTTNSVDCCRSTDGIIFELEPLMHRTQDMFDAAASGHVNDIQSFLSNNNYATDVQDQSGYSALHHAARMNRARVIEYMSTAGANVDIYSADGLTPLHLAARSDALEALDVLLKKGAQVNVTAKHSSRTPLHLAAHFGHVKIIQRLLMEKNVDINATDQQGMNALHAAISRGYKEICDVLLKNGANVTMTTANGQTCLHLAAAGGNASVVLLIIQYASEVHLRQPGDAIGSIKDVPAFYQFINQTDSAKNTALHIAVQAGTAAICEALIENGADMNIHNKSLHTPLHMAAIGNHSEILEFLIDQGAQVPSKDFKQKTALHSAATFGNLNCLEILLRNCAFVNAKDARDLTPFLCAVVAGKTKCVELLLDSGADISARDKFQRTCIHLAVEHERENTLQMLVDKCGTGMINTPDEQDKTPLHYAVLSSIEKLRDVLLKNKANCLLKDSTGKTPLHIAAEAGMVRHVEALTKSSFASVSQKDPDDRTPLHFAALNGNGKICSILIQMGAEIDLPDAYGWTPLLFAAKSGSAGVIRMLLEINAKIDHADQSGNTALLIASARGYVDAVRILLDQKASLSPSNDGLNCLDVAIENQQVGVTMAILTNSRWRDILSAKSLDGGNRMGKLIERFPDAARSVMDRCIQRSAAKRSITYDFRLLDPGCTDESGPGNEPFFGLLEMVKHRRKDLLVHDLSRKLLAVKWRTYGWFVFWTNLAMYAVFLFVMSYFMLTQRKQITLTKGHNADSESVFKKNNKFNEISPYLILVFALFHLLKELYQIGAQKMKYFTQATNLLEWILYLATTIFILPYVSSDLGYLRGDPRVAWQVGTVAIFLGYMNLILFMQTLKRVGIYVTMFFQVARTVLRALSFFTLFSLAFSVVFFILFKEQDAFASFDMALMQVLKMTLGELDYDTVMVDSLNETNSITKAPLLPYRESSTLFMAIFIFAMPIILTNLLVGLAVGDIESVQKQAFLKNKETIIDFVVGIERKFPKFITSRFYKPQLVVTGRRFVRKNKLDTFKDKDLVDEDAKSEIEEDPSLAVLTNDLAMVKQRQAAIMNAMQDQMNILKVVASKVGAGAHQ